MMLSREKLGGSFLGVLSVVVAACGGEVEATEPAASTPPSSGAYRVRVLEATCSYALPETDLFVSLCPEDGGASRANIPLLTLRDGERVGILRQDVEVPGTLSYVAAKGSGGACAGQRYSRTVDVEPSASGLVVRLRDTYRACAGGTEGGDTACELRYALDQVRTCPADGVLLLGEPRGSVRAECTCP